MKTLMLTTALVLATAGGTLAQAPAAPLDPAVTITGNVPGFRASSFTGMTLHTLSPEVVTDLRAMQPVDPDWDARAERWTSSDTFVAGREQWQNIGAINDIVLSQDGHIQGVLLDIGGFLGIGARTVMVDIDDLYFVADSATPDDISDFVVVASMSREQLEALPEWSDDNLSAGYAWDAPLPAEEQVTAVGEVAPTPADTMVTAPTTDELTGADVHDLAGTSIGNVNDLVLSGDTVSGALIDVGGFLGIGSKTVLVPIDALSVVRDADQSVVRIETSLTREHLEALPEHAG